VIGANNPWAKFQINAVLGPGTTTSLAEQIINNGTEYKRG
jgi:hypothetical protein